MYLRVVQILTGICVWIMLVSGNASFAQSSPVSAHPDSLLLPEEVTVTGKSATRLSNERPVSAIVIDIRPYHTQSADFTQILNRLPGVRIRTNGSAGAPVSINLNGLQGRAVRLFRDGVPADYLGRAFNPGLLSPNSFQRVEVYKGVVPVELGADALGGAVNFVRQEPDRNRVAAGWEAGSYGSRKAVAALYWADTTSGMFTSLDGYLTDALNNYKVEVQVADPETARLTDVRVRRFNDRQRNAYAEWNLGWKDRKQANTVSMSLAWSGLHSRLQHAAFMSVPYKYAFATESGLIPSFRYKKTFKKVYTDAFVSVSTFTNRLTDTSSVRYNWLQEPVSTRNNGGELSTANKSLLELSWRHTVARLSAAWQVNRDNRIDAGYTATYQSRTGQDPVGARTLGGIDPFRMKARYNRMTGGVSWTGTSPGRKLENVSGLKYFNYYASGFDILAHYIYKDERTETSGSSFGVFEAVKYSFSSNWFARASYEWSNRLPDQTELLGDGMFVRGNFSLRPERSHNVNLGANYQVPGLLLIEAGAFYRHAQNLLFLQPGVPFSTYINLDQTRIAGGELAGSIKVSQQIQAGGNLTYQDARRVHIALPAEKYLENARIPNMPFFFYNLYARFRKARIIGNKARLDAWYYLSHIDRFDLYFNPAAGNEFVIPAQNIHSISVSLAFPATGITLGAEARNLFDARLYDYYRVQRPGRTFHVKLNYEFSFKQ